MPELPEVETVRRGLDVHLVGRQVVQAVQLHPRALNSKSIATLDALVGSQVLSTQRRGKFLWCVLDRPYVLVAHLGMSGQFLINATDQRHSRALLKIRKGRHESELHFNDQRTFGWLSIEETIHGIPTSAQAIALDPFDHEYDQRQVIANIKRRKVSIKTAILNQNIVSGIGNIYADESLWLSKVHPERRSDAMRPAEIGRVLNAAKTVMSAALKVGGTSFDALYINVNGESGYFDISLNAYGREEEPCTRCGRPIKRIKFANRSSHFCPRCQQLR